MSDCHDYGVKELPYPLKMRIWLKFYARVQGLAACLARGKIGNTTLSSVERWDIQKKIKSLLEESSDFMNKCGWKMPGAKWNYDEEDKSTWASSKDFAYKHLMER
jgi:hypothetical protein